MDSHQKQILQRRIDHKHKHELKRKKKRKHLKRLEKQDHARVYLRKHRQKHGKFAKLDTNENNLELIMPEIICDSVAEYSNSLLHQIEKIEREIKEGTDKNIIFNFNQTHTINVGGAAIIKAFYDKIKFNQPDKRIKITVSKEKDKIRQILQYIGIKNYGIEITHEDISRWVVKVYDCDVEKENLMKDIHEPIKNLTNWGSDKKIKKILEAIPEACWNSFEHGYQLMDRKDPTKEKFTKSYLIFGKTEKSYSFCIFDRGIGFRGSFGYYHRDLLKDLLASISEKSKAKQEHLIIEKAIELGRSKAPGLGRGSGLSSILETITKSLKGYVAIHSLRGYYSKEHKPDKQSEQSPRSDIHGTLVQFQIPIA